MSTPEVIDQIEKELNYKHIKQTRRRKILLNLYLGYDIANPMDSVKAMGILRVDKSNEAINIDDVLSLAREGLVDLDISFNWLKVTLNDMGTQYLKDNYTFVKTGRACEKSTNLAKSLTAREVQNEP
jgi:hypothetical protein